MTLAVSVGLGLIIFACGFVAGRFVEVVKIDTPDEPR